MLDGPVVDLNVMTRRGGASHHVRLLACGDDFTACSGFAAVLALDTAKVRIGENTITLSPLDTLTLDPEATVTFVAGAGIAVQIRLQP